ncbi:MAG: Site-specific recombinase XerD [Modestobacter sp.]|nr:Site-specific recombinase XerD [Modestobacter sp.]
MDRRVIRGIAEPRQARSGSATYRSGLRLKTARACLSGMFSLAIDDGAVTFNPVRDASVRLDTTARRHRGR